ncbi:MAG TPA: phosphorylase [Polyangia bacterium]|jgi:futalosine hydrolase
MAATLVLAAWEPEIAPLRRLARAIDPARLALGTVGVGPVEAAVGAAAAIAAARPARVIFVGTAGAYPRGRATAAIGTAALAGELHLVSTAALRGDGYLPEPLVARAGPADALNDALAACGAGGRSIARLGVACPLAVTRSATLGRQIAHATGAGLENLELFAVARAAAAAGVGAVTGVLGIANRVGPRGHQEWRAHHVAASRAACRVVWNYLRSI